MLNYTEQLKSCVKNIELISNWQYVSFGDANDEKIKEFQTQKQSWNKSIEDQTHEIIITIWQEKHLHSTCVQCHEPSIWKLDLEKKKLLFTHIRRLFIIDKLQTEVDQKLREERNKDEKNLKFGARWNWNRSSELETVKWRRLLKP